MKLELAELTGGKLEGTIDVTYGVSCDSGTQEGSFAKSGCSLGEVMKEAAKHTDSWKAKRANRTDIVLANAAYTDIDVYTLENGEQVHHGYKTFGPESAALAKIHRDFDGKVILKIHAHKQHVKVEYIADHVEHYPNWI